MVARDDADEIRDPQHPRRILVMQRLHERDLTAEMVREGATVLRPPMRHERAHPAGGPRPAHRGGQLLVPERYTPRPSGAWRRAWAARDGGRSSSSALRRRGARSSRASG